MPRKPSLSGLDHHLLRCSFDPLLIGGSIVHPAASVRDLGVILDPALSFVNHVAKLTGISFYHIRQLRSIRHSLTIDSCHSFVRALIVSRLDYCNGLLGGAPAFLLDRLSVWCSSGCSEGRSATSKNEPDIGRNEGVATLARYSSTSQLQAVRPCVPVPPWFCTALLNKMLRSCHPWTIGSLDLRSADSAKGRLVVPKSNTKTISRRAFAISCPLAWNSLPDDLHDDSLSLMEFRKKLKTVLF